MRIKMTVAAVFVSAPNEHAKFVGIAVTNADYNNLRDSVLNIYPDVPGVVVTSEYREIEFDVTTEMLL